MLAANTILQSRYRILRKLGEGGMGTVYEAMDQRVSCLVALKETRAESDVETRRAFEREASLLANLRHPSLPKVMDYFSEGDGDFLVMEFIPGYDLGEMLELRGSPFPQAQVLHWADDLLRVVEYLHGQEPPVLHRDIKPSNLKLTKRGEIFLLDFGLAKGTAGQMPALATSRSVRGYTPVYASLEQILGQGTDPRSDIYSLGATLYHLLTGVPPTNAPARFHAVEEEQPDPLLPAEALNPQATARVAAVIHRAMAVTRKQRPASAAETRTALRNAAEEDERDAAEEAYHQAEAKRHEREQERQNGEAATRKRDDAYYRQSEQPLLVPTRSSSEETRRPAEEEELSSKASLHKVQHEDALNRAKAQPETEERVEPEPTVAAPGQPEAQVQPNRKPRHEAAKREVEPPLKTIPGPPPEPFSFDRFDRKETKISNATDRPGRKRQVIMGVIVLAAILGGILLVLELRRKFSPRTTSGPMPASTGTAKAEKVAAPEGMIYVSGGSFMMGRNKSDGGDDYESPAHQVTVPPFFMDIYEVTNDDYAKFVRATNNRPPETWNNGSYPAADGHKPVTGMEWADANAYAKWAGKRLPSEEEWEFAARGTDGRRYPWGNDWQQGMANANGASNGLVDVGTYKGASPFNVFDMVGNAWEWTSTTLNAYPAGQLPQRKTQFRSVDLKVIRGGTFDSDINQATCTYRAGWPAHATKDYPTPYYGRTGFRCVRDLNQAPSASPEPTLPTTVQARLRLLSQGASHYSGYPGLAVTLRAGGQSFTQKTNNSGWVSFKEVPCGKAITINASGFLQSGTNWQVKRELPCQSDPVLIGAFGDLQGTPLKKADWKFILEK